MYIPTFETETERVPTRETYDAFQHAYDHFNWTLFDRELPNCLITLQRTKRSYGYFCHKRFEHEDGGHCDEIALNPIYFEQRSASDVLSTLVHEMVHLWQFHFGKPGRGRYHNREWAERMKSIGLYPSNTGEPGGRELGDQMTHYIVDGGSFERSAASLIGTGFVIEWKDAQRRKTSIASPTSKTGSGTSGSGAEGSLEPAPAPKSGTRMKYTCPACGLNAWAKHDVLLLCGEDRVPLLAS